MGPANVVHRRLMDCVIDMRPAIRDGRTVFGGVTKPRWIRLPTLLDAEQADLSVTTVMIPYVPLVAVCCGMVIVGAGLACRR
jgi:hypothetical protein